MPTPSREPSAEEQRSLFQALYDYEALALHFQTDADEAIRQADVPERGEGLQARRGPLVVRRAREHLQRAALRRVLVVDLHCLFIQNFIARSDGGYTPALGAGHMPTPHPS